MSILPKNIQHTISGHFYINRTINKTIRKYVNKNHALTIDNVLKLPQNIFNQVIREEMDQF